MERNVRRGHTIMLVTMVLSVIGGFFIEALPEYAYEIMWQPLLLALPAIIMLKKMGRPLNEALRLNPLTWKDIAKLVGVTLAFQPFITLIAIIASMIFGDQLEFLFEGFDDMPAVVLFLTLVVMPALCEEIVLRGAVMDGYRKMPVKTMIIMNGVLFGLFHTNMNQFMYTSVMGMFLAYAVYKTHSIWAGVLIHFVNNGLSAIVTLRPAGTIASLENWMYTLETVPGLIRFAIFVVLSIGLSLWLSKRIGRHPKAQQAYEAEQQKQFELPEQPSQDTPTPHNSSQPVPLPAYTMSGSEAALVQEPIFDWALGVITFIFIIISTLLWVATAMASAGMLEM